MDMTAGYQRHCSTHTAHFYSEGSRVSACKREQKHTGEVIDSTDFMVCSRCLNTTVRQEHERGKSNDAPA